MHEISSNRLRAWPSLAGEDGDALVGSKCMPAWPGATKTAGANPGRRKFAPKCGYALPA